MSTLRDDINMVKKNSPSSSQVFGLAIKSIREEKGFTQFDLWDKCGIDRSYLSDIERGRRNPSLNTIIQIAQGLEVKAYNLFRKAQI